MNDQYWSWLLTVVGLTGFILAGRKVWWAWYINIGCQALWFTYAIVTEQHGFIVAAIAYTVVFARNAYKWTTERSPSKLREHFTTEDNRAGVVVLSKEAMYTISNFEPYVDRLILEIKKQANAKPNETISTWIEDRFPEGGIAIHWEVEKTPNDDKIGN
jgi:hypothetical protein